MPIRAPGWAHRADSALATGTTSLTVDVPTGTVDGDILVLSFSHKGAGWGSISPAAGWSLIGRDISGATRLEVYWRRASSEPANYSITGLATAAAGGMSAYDGGLAAGNVLEAVSVQANPAGTEDAPSITVATEHALMVACAAWGANTGFSRIGCTSAAPAGPEDDTDVDLRRFLADRQEGGHAGGIRLIQSDAIKVVPGPTGNLYYDNNGADSENVGLLCVLIPEDSQGAAGTRYYLTSNPPPFLWDAPLQGRWRGANWGANGNEITTAKTYMLDERRSAAGVMVVNDFKTNQQADYDVCTARWVSPPLEPTTITGTLNLTWAVGALWEDFAAGMPIDSSVVHHKIHAYVTAGDSFKTKRGILLDQWIDPTKVPFATASYDYIGTDLTGPPTVTPVTVQRGDRVCIEIGFRVVSSPTPTPTYPPTEWTQMLFTGWGTTHNEDSKLDDAAGVPYLDTQLAVVGQRQAAYVQFSHDLVEATGLLATAPAHSTWQTAILISDPLPFWEQAGHDTTTVAQAQRAVWYEWVADRSGYIICWPQASNYAANMRVFHEYAGFANQPILSDHVLESNGVAMGVERNRCLTILNAVEGTRYWFKVFTHILPGASGPSCGGRLHFGLWAFAPLEEDDLIMVAGRSIWATDDCGNPKANQWEFQSFTPSGVAIDYSKLPMADLADASYPALTNTEERAVIALHDTSLTEVISLHDLSVDHIEIDFIGAPWDGQLPNELAVDSQGRVVQAFFGNGYLHVSAAGGIAGFLSAPSDDLALSALHRISLQKADSQPGGPFPGEAETWQLPTEIASANSIALDPDNERIVWYTSPAWYWSTSQEGGVPQDLRATQIKRFDMDAGVALADVATIVADTEYVIPGLKGLTVLPGGKGCLVCNGGKVHWVTVDGRIVQTYRASPVELAPFLTSPSLKHDLSAFWVKDHESHTCFLFDLMSGSQIRCFTIYDTPGVGTGLTLYRPNGYDTPCW